MNLVEVSSFSVTMLAVDVIKPNKTSPLMFRPRKIQLDGPLLSAYSAHHLAVVLPWH